MGLTQDMYLTGSPQITYFKGLYRRHSNFSMEAVEQTFSGTVDFNKRVSCTISRNGDLIHKVYLQATIPDVAVSDASGFAWGEELGHFLMKTIELEIGGSRIDKHYGTWLSIWNELTLPSGKTTGYNTMIGNVSSLTTNVTNGTVSGTTLYIPLQFAFNRHIGLSLPLIALAYHEVKITIEFDTIANLTSANNPTSTPSLGNTSLFVDYIYLDTDERKQFAANPHEYLIEQLQHTGTESISGSSTQKFRLSFNHPVKELIWVVQDDNRVRNNYTDANDGTGENPVATAQLKLNGHDRFSEREGTYFNLVQPYQHHTNTPSNGINVYSFAINPEDHQPSGTLNLSRIDSANLHCSFTADGSTNASNPFIRIYATNYNVLRIVSGMGGLSYTA
jgi:hypothetical protein